jgi:hypothetical protein
VFHISNKCIQAYLGSVSNLIAPQIKVLTFITKLHSMHEDMLVAGLEEDNNNQYHGNKSDTVGVNQPIQNNEPTNTTIDTPSTSCASALLHYASRSVRCLCLPYYVDGFMFVLHFSLVLTM